ncbi:MAG: hypothetical protein NT144_06230 [Bacteroidia bacterium]|nr:hypothetical protein [Bacteroidia bacterium]
MYGKSFKHNTNECFPFRSQRPDRSYFSKAGIDFNEYIEERKEFAAEFVIKAITKQEVPKVLRVIIKTKKIYEKGSPVSDNTDNPMDLDYKGSEDSYSKRVL